MPVSIEILSGSRQGQRLELDQPRIEIGDQPTADIRFDTAADPEAAGRRAVLTQSDGGWQVESASSGPLFLNQQVVDGPTPVGSGDLLRLSYDGPDLVIHSSAAVTAASEMPVAEVVSQSRRDWRDFLVPAAALGALLCLVVLAVSARSWLGLAGETIEPPRFQPFGVLQCDEGETLFWRPTLVGHHHSDRFSLDDTAPDGLQIDSSTGTLRWPTGETDGPGEYQCQLTVTRGDDAELSDTANVEIRVDEVNQSPIVSALPIQQVNLATTNQLRLTIQASDPDQPAQQLSYQLAPEAPAGVSLDSQSGKLSWQIDPATAVGLVEIPFRVSDSASPPALARGVVRVRVETPDPWELTRQQLVDSVFLIVALTKQGKLILPLGTGCAVTERELVSSASVGVAIGEAIGKGWDVLAIDTREFDASSPAGRAITDARAHVVYLRAAEIDNPQQRGLRQAFFDLAILTTTGDLLQPFRLGSVESSVKNNQTVACSGYSIDGASLTRFDQPQPAFEQIQVLAVITPPDEQPSAGRQPLLLQLAGELPQQMFGGVIVNDAAEVLGVYAFEGEIPPEAKSPPIHYAPEILPVKAYLAGQGRHLWKSTLQRSDQSL